METIKLTEEQIEEAQQALLVLVELFGDPMDVVEVHCAAGGLIRARVLLRNSQGKKYVVHADNDDVCPCNWRDEDLSNCQCGKKTGDIADEWVRAGFVCRTPKTEEVVY